MWERACSRRTITRYQVKTRIGFPSDHALNIFDPLRKEQRVVLPTLMPDMGRRQHVFQILPPLKGLTTRRYCQI
ncbi:hypothetical protein PS880_00545 [Pseudomonas fluorescens]|uniref:Uncharacterized protein n=1 Tax=Pseudomonas fluorescens TaxID=294 RepID=A0A5E7GWH1_PSEFL|nr:hypothetical protein PS880_00545 [Pseudomonas fluorescens]